MLGSAGASKILLHGQAVDAAAALRLGIVDKVVSLRDLDQRALEVAQSFAQMPHGYSIGIKRLLNYDSKELADCLEFENKLLRRQIFAGHRHGRTA
jgi:enoyl-CoA hydratase/carnithine racemase